MLSPLLSATITQAQGPSPIFSALGYAFRRIVVAQVTALNGIMYDVLFIAASSGSKQYLIMQSVAIAYYTSDMNTFLYRPTSRAEDDLRCKQSWFTPVHQPVHSSGDLGRVGGPNEPLHLLKQAQGGLPGHQCQAHGHPRG